uniref:Toxin HicA n=1 Tax=Candidatus Kentrum sp. FW TaxID=2126338 RepID=A0A450T0I9_9GAMM|nr:MAG: hypothetical protein BECKFW1821B_GA0114236_10535 [Candidatus Kentron sp. FW]
MVIPPARRVGAGEKSIAGQAGKSQQINASGKGMNSVAKIMARMKANPAGVRFSELKKVCEYYFGRPRQSASSHCLFKTPWHGDPRVNIQNHQGKAKPYQVKQVLLAIEKIEVGT